MEVPGASVPRGSPHGENSPDDAGKQAVTPQPRLTEEAAATGQSLGKPSRTMVELEAGPDVEKIGMVCALPPKILAIRKIAPGGWADTQGVVLGDIMTEVNGVPACQLLAEDLKAAMLQRPLRFKLADPSCNVAAVKIQCASRSRTARKLVAMLRAATTADSAAGNDSMRSDEGHLPTSPVASASDEERSVASALHKKRPVGFLESVQDVVSMSRRSSVDDESVIVASPSSVPMEELSLDQLRAQCRKSGIMPLPSASKADLLSAITNLQASPVSTILSSPSPAASPSNDPEVRVSPRWPTSTEEAEAEEAGSDEVEAGKAEPEEAGAAGANGIEKFLHDEGGGSGAFAAALAAATKIQSVQRGRSARKSLGHRDATTRRLGHLVSGAEAEGLAAALDAASSRNQPEEQTMSETFSDQAERASIELAAQSIQKLHRGRQARKHVEVLRRRKADVDLKEAAAVKIQRIVQRKRAALRRHPRSERGVSQADAAVPKKALDEEEAAIRIQSIRRRYIARKNLVKSAQDVKQAEKATTEILGPAKQALDEEDAAVRIQRIRRAHVAKREVARAAMSVSRPELAEADAAAAQSSRLAKDSVLRRQQVEPTPTSRGDLARKLLAASQFEEEAYEDNGDDYGGDCYGENFGDNYVGDAMADDYIDYDLHEDGYYNEEEDFDDDILAGLQIPCFDDESYSPHARAVPGTDPNEIWNAESPVRSRRTPLQTPLEDKVRDLMEHVRMLQEEESPHASRRGKPPRDASLDFKASVREVSAPPLSRSPARHAEIFSDSDGEQLAIISPPSRGADHRGARGRASSAEPGVRPQAGHLWGGPRNVISEDQFFGGDASSEDVEPSAPSAPSAPAKIRAPVPAARRFELLCPEAPRERRRRPDTGATALQEFKMMLLQREHGFVRAWRQILDIGGNGRLTLAELCEGCRRLGFRGNIRDLWQELDADGIGMITLCELDWDSAFALAKFHATLVLRYGNLKAAAKQLGFTGMRRFKHDEFCSLLQKQKIAPQHEAAPLFKMLCTCPPASTLDRDAGVSVREFEWLRMMSKHLPQVGAYAGSDRLEPGMMLDGSSDRQVMDDSLNDEGVYEDDDLDKMASENVFNKLYQQAVELQERQKDREEEQNRRPQQVATHGPIDPHRFSRLYNDHKEKQEKKERNTEEFYRNQMQQDGPKQISDEVWERLLKPKEKSLEDEPLDIRSECRTTSLDVLPMAQIRSACEQEGLDCRGRTREEMLDALKILAKEREARVPKPQPKMSSRMEKLYNDHEKRQRAAEERELNAREKQEQELQAMKLGAGKRADPAMYNRLYARAEEQERKRQLELEKKEAKELAELEAYKAKGEFKPETMYRLYYDGMDRDAKRNDKKRMQELQEEVRMKEVSIHKNKTRDPKCFERLYNNANKKRSAQRRDSEGDLEDFDGEPLEPPAVQSRQQMPGQMPARPTREDLSRMLHSKEEAVEVAQRMAAGTVKNGYPANASTAAPPSTLKGNAAPATLEVAQRMAAGTVKNGYPADASAAAPPSILKGNAAAATRDVTPPRRAAGPKPGQALQVSRNEESHRKVTFNNRVAAVESSNDVVVRPSEVGIIRDFAEYLFRKFPDANAAFDAFDIYRTGQVGLTSFISGGKRIQFTGDIKGIFRALDVNLVGHLGKNDFRVLMQFHPRVVAQNEGHETLERPKNSNQHFMVRTGAAPAGRPAAQGANKARNELGRAPKAGPGESGAHPQEEEQQRQIPASIYAYKGRGVAVGSCTSKEAPASKMQQPKVRAAAQMLDRGRHAAQAGSVEDEELPVSRSAAAGPAAEPGGFSSGAAAVGEGRYPHKARSDIRSGPATAAATSASSLDGKPKSGSAAQTSAILRARAQEADRAAAMIRKRMERSLDEVPLVCDEEFLQLDKGGSDDDGSDSDTAVPSPSWHSKDCSTPPSPRSSTPPSPHRSGTTSAQAASKPGQAIPRSSLAAQRMQRSRHAVFLRDGAAASQHPEAGFAQPSRKSASASSTRDEADVHRGVGIDDVEVGRADSDSPAKMRHRGHRERLSAKEEDDDEEDTGKLQDEVKRLLLEYQEDIDLTPSSRGKDQSQEGAELSSESAWVRSSELCSESAWVQRRDSVT